MSQNNARLIEKNILAGSALLNTEAGDSEIIDLSGATKFSLQAVYDVTAVGSAAVMASATNVKLSSDPTNPSEFLKVAHGLVAGLKVQIATGTTLPVPFAAVTDYFVIRVGADSFALATTIANAKAGTRIAITNVGVGNQTVTPVAASGMTITFRKSNDKSNWVDIQTATSFSADGTVMIENAAVAFRYVKVVKALTAGDVSVVAQILVIGDNS